jgi:hypothetical protein
MWEDAGVERVARLIARLQENGKPVLRLPLSPNEPLWALTDCSRRGAPVKQTRCSVVVGVGVGRLIAEVTTH